MAVTFCFLFVALPEKATDRIVNFISMMLQHIRKQKEFHYRNMSNLMPSYSLNNCPEYLIKDYHCLNKNLAVFDKLIRWNPIHMSPWCLFCGLYGLILLFLYAELSAKPIFMDFFLVFVELTTLVNLIYFLIELYDVFLFTDGKKVDCSYGRAVMIFIIIFLTCLFCSFFGITGQLLISTQIIFYWSIFLAFLPFIITMILAFVFAVASYIYSFVLSSRMEDFNTDYNSEMRRLKKNSVFEFGSTKDNEGFSFQ